MILYLTKNSVENTFFSVPFSFLLAYERKSCWMRLLSEVALLVRQKLLDKKKNLWKIEKVVAKRDCFVVRNVR